MTSVTLEDAQANLPELIEHLPVGEVLVITRNARPIARLLSLREDSSESLGKQETARGCLLSLPMTTNI